MVQTHNTLPVGTRESMIEMLNQQLADAIQLGSHAKAAHWGVRGSSFIALHKLFDEVYEAVDEQIDAIAERVTALGGATESALSVVAERSRLGDYPLQIADGPDHVQALAHSLATFGEGLREGIEEADEASDPATADLLTGMLRETDKFLWFVEAHAPVAETAAHS